MSQTENCWNRDDLLDRIARLQRLNETKKNAKSFLESSQSLEDVKTKFNQKRLHYEKHLKQLDEKLNELGLNQSPIGGDGNCFYLAMCDQLKRNDIIPDNYDFTEGIVLGIPRQYPLAAKRCRFDLVLHMARNSNDYRLGYTRKQFGKYLQRMRLNAKWAGGQEIAAASDFYNVCIECFSVSSDGLNLETYFPRRIENESESEWESRCQNLKTLRLCLHGNHFWSTRSHEENELEMEMDKEVSESIDSDSDSDEEEIICKLFIYKGKEYLLGTSPLSEKNKVYERNAPNDYIGRLKCQENGENMIDFSIEED